MLHIPTYRRVQRKLFGNLHRSSYPFISGDSFRALCDVKIDRKTDFDKSFGCNSQSKSIFVSAGVSNDFVNFIGLQLDLDLSDCTLVIHNGDLIPNDGQLTNLASRFRQIHSVNWLGTKSVVSPLPIGLENWAYYRNGVPSDFLSRSHSAGKDIDFLVAFSDHTFPTARARARDIFREFPGTYEVKQALPPSKYLDLVRRSKYVVSPPGNGADCHRTWEALYLGATPIVLKDYWPNFNLPLPVIVVDEWEDTPSRVVDFEKTKPHEYISIFDFAQGIFGQIKGETLKNIF